MNASIVRTLASLCLCAALGPVSLQAQMLGHIRVTIPFGFTVGAKSLAAGEYRVLQMTPSVLAMQSIDGRSSAIVMTHPSRPTTASGRASMTFNKYGDRYFLAKVSDDGRGWELPKTPVEKELIAKRASPPQPVVVDTDEQ